MNAGADPRDAAEKSLVMSFSHRARLGSFASMRPLPFKS
jgi:hypothetical protein